MYVALPIRRQHQLLANSFGTGEKLEKSRNRLAPVLENEKAGVFILNQPAPFYLRWAVSMKGGDVMT